MRASRDSIDDVWGPRTPYELEWPVRVDERLAREPERWIRSACILCSNGCAVDVGVAEGRIVGVRGVATDRVNHGRLGPKGLHGWQANDAKDRLTHPLIRRGSRLRRASWDEAMSLIVHRCRDLLAERGPGALGFHDSGQLLLEEYYTLTVVTDAGLGTPNVDGSTRLCTATAAVALSESFGSDGQPGSFSDFDHADAVFLFGHNMAETQTVNWARILDRRRGPRPPTLVVADPRESATAAEADVHLALRPGTNLPLMLGILHVLLREGWIDAEFVARHTVGLDDVRKVTDLWPPERAAEVTRLPLTKLLAAARILGTSPRLVSTVLQGVYQSHEASATAVQVNNLHLLRGMIGKPGCAVFQMNGQPTAQNTRECGADGTIAGFRNWANRAHREELAKLWNVDPSKLPYGNPPTHAMGIFRQAEMGSIGLLWVMGTNPAVSLPDLRRIRKILDREKLLVVVSEAWMNETAEHADVVLPVAIWGEKTGCGTNADRTVHLLRKAVDPPGEARSDLEILLDFARRMEFVDKDSEPLVKWTDAEGAFDAWKKCSVGRPCDYSGLTYEKLEQGTGIQWPCNAAHPEGRERLYEDGVFPTGADVCETFGHDIGTGAEIEEKAYRERDPEGRAIMKACDHAPAYEEPDTDYPLALLTGRVVWHWHTRTKTGRVPELNREAPDVFVELSREDAQELGIGEGDLVEVTSRRGSVRGPARITGIAAGAVFVPFHYGAWGASTDDAERAANELTLTGWDPISLQPYYKSGAARVARIGEKGVE